MSLASKLFGGEGGRGWTVATILVAGILLALFIGEVADVLSYGLAASINATSSFHNYAVEGINGSQPEVLYQGQAGQYSYVVTKPGNSALGQLLSFLLYLLPALVTILSEPGYLLIIIGASLIVVAYSLEVR